ncbi:cysteine-rich receptor-like protein kinase 8 [Tanacetum coccineum]
MLRQEEKQRETTTPKYTSPAIMSTYSNPNQHQHPQAFYRHNRTSSSNSNYRNDSNQRRSAFRQGVYCGNYQKEGHYKSECYQLVGYPIGHPLHSKVKPINKGADSKPRVVNLAVRSDGASTSGKDLNDDATVFAKMDNLHNQLKQVMMMLQNSQGVCDPKIMAASRYFFIASIISHFKDAWVCDSGATNHICITLSLIFNIKHCQTAIIVSLPNGHQTLVTITGSVRIKPKLTLHNVFFIPTFAYNLLSISQVTKTTTLSVIFDHFQGNNQKIAHGIQSDELYIITPDSTPSSPSPTTPSVNTICKDSHLWHLRLGHPSVNVQKQIKSLPYFSNGVNPFHCNICPLSKQTALPFPISNSHAQNKFDLVHADTWGPFKHTTQNNCNSFLP